MLDNVTVDIEEINIKNWVTKSNDLIEATYRLNLQEQRILLIMASKIQPNDQMLVSYRFRAKDFIDVISDKKGTGYYSHLKEVVNGLQTKVLTIYDKGVQRNYNWVITSIYEEQQGYITLQFHPELKGFFLQLKEKFTTYQLENVVRLTSMYSIRIYELLKRYEFIKKRTFTLEELRHYLAIEPEKYQQYGHFKKKVLSVALNEINAKTDICFSFKEIKTGRKVTSIQFVLEKKGDTESLPAGKVEIPDKEQLLSDSLMKELGELGLTLKDIKECANNYSETQISRNINYVKHIMQNSDIKNIAAYLLKAIENDYASQNSKKSGRKRAAKKEVMPERFTKGDEIEPLDENFEAEKAALLKDLEERKRRNHSKTV